MRFRDRREAGRRLAEALAGTGLVDPVVLALPRGGVPVAAEVAMALEGSLDVFVARKVGAPQQPELGIGAVAEGGGTVADPRALELLRITPGMFERLAEDARAELSRRVQRYRGGRPLHEVAGRDVVLVDDGLATGVTAEAALRALRQMHPRRLVLAAPVAAPDTAERLREIADDVVTVSTPEGFAAVGSWYDDFTQTTDDEVLDLLGRDEPAAKPVEEEVAIPQDGGVQVCADLVVPPDAVGLVVFAHGSGSSRRSGRNRAVAGALQGRGFATLLLDLLTSDEEAVDLRTRELRFDIGLLARRLDGAVRWAGRAPPAAGLRVGLFGASTGAAAALIVAAERPGEIAAVVSRGGRPDLADEWLPRVVAPVRLLVGGEDHQVIQLNRSAYDRLEQTKARDLELVPGATHLFEEPGALDAVARLAGDWFAAHLAPR